MNLTPIGCKTMRDGIVVSIVFLAFAVILLLVARYAIPDVAFLPRVLLFFAAILLLMAPLILLGTYLKTVHRAHTSACAEKPKR